MIAFSVTLARDAIFYVGNDRRTIPARTTVTVDTDVRSGVTFYKLTAANGDSTEYLSPESYRHLTTPR